MAAGPYSLDKVAIRMVREPPLYSSRPIKTPDDAVRLLAETLKDYDREVIALVNLRSDLSPINMSIVSIGALDASIAHPREILKSPILSNAASVLLFHNHPSGNLSPSKEDVRITDRLQKVFDLAGIDLLDHIIVGSGDLYYSFREKGTLPLSGNRYVTDVEELHFKPLPGMMAAEEAAVYSEPDRIKAITDKLEAGITDLFQSDAYKTWLTTMSRFHNYSLNNTLLIAMQKPDATLVAGYQAWQKQHQRHVKKGEKGIRIIAPAPYKAKKERAIVDPATGKPKLDVHGDPMKEIVEVEFPAFKVATVFDVSQTEGKEIPSLGVNELPGKVDGYKDFLTALTNACPVPVGFEQIDSGAKGYFHLKEKRIALQKGMSEIQTVKTLIHEMAHQKLHSYEKENAEEAQQTARSREVEAESVAYTVCQHFGIDTAEYSFGYIAGWSSGKETEELKASLGRIRTAASEMITEIKNRMMEMEKAPALEAIPETETPRTSAKKKQSVLKALSCCPAVHSNSKPAIQTQES